MVEQREREDAVRTLNRMLAYIRDEALRLRILDVAILLEHAQAAVTTFVPERGRRLPVRHGTDVEH